MIKKQSLVKNYTFQFLYQALILVIPFIISPYLTRTLREDALGTYTYINSIAYYFIIIANLGISVHGKRLLSRVSSDEQALRKSFWSLFYTHIIISLAVTLVYFLFIFCLQPTNIEIFSIEGIYVLSALFDITWLFYGLEIFSSVVIKNAVVKILECIFIFVFVHTPSDTWIYALIISLGTLLGHAVMLPQAVTLVKPIKVCKDDMISHIKPILLFSVAVIATTLYTVFDKTLLGILATKADVAFYEYANRIIAIPQTFVGVIGTVMLPRASKLVADRQIDAQKKYMTYSFYVTAFIGMAGMFGICAISDQLAVVYYGDAFAACGNIMKALSPLAYIIGTGSVLRSQCLIPNGMDRQFNICIIYNAVINLVLSLLLIPTIGVFGAVIGTLSAEIFGIVYQAILCKKIVNWRSMIAPLIPFAIIGITMFCVVKIIASFMPISVSALIIQVVVGAGVYFLLSIIYFYVFKREIVMKLLKTVAVNKRK